MKYQDFIKNVTFGDMTAFVFDEPSNCNCYSSGEVDEDTFGNTTSDTEFEIKDINDYPEVKQIIIDNFLSEIAPAKGIEDENYNEVRNSIINGDCKLGIWKEGNCTTYMLLFC